jgi:hypothetical protein
VNKKAKTTSRRSPGEVYKFTPEDIALLTTEAIPAYGRGFAEIAKEYFHQKKA